MTLSIERYYCHINFETTGKSSGMVRFSMIPLAYPNLFTDLKYLFIKFFKCRQLHFEGFKVSLKVR